MPGAPGISRETNKGGSDVAMVVEVVEVRVKEDKVSEYPTALRDAFAILERQPGCLTQRAFQCVEDPQVFHLIITWEKIEDHTEGFRKSKDLDEFRNIVSGYYEQGPQVRHFTEVNIDS